jgi:hypothetical protein
MQYEEEPRWTGHITGYCNRGPLYGRPAPYHHNAACNRGELGRAFPRIEKRKYEKKKPQPPKD